MIRSIKGVKDILPAQIPKWQVIEKTARRLAHQYGFSEIRIPIFEQTELYSRSIGTSTDIVEKEMYTFNDRDGTSLSLRPEGTAGVVRSYLEHNLANDVLAKKLFYLGPMFRHERPQSGRFRQFHQFGVEAFGTDDPYLDTEIISLLWQYFLILGLTELTLNINTLGSFNERQIYIAELKKFLSSADGLCGNCLRRLDTNPLRVLDCKVPQCRTIVSDAPTISDHLSTKSASHFKEVLTNLQSLSIPYTVDPHLVRGLDYYSMTTFEITSPSLGAQNTIGAGGRYDGLFQALGGPATPAIGFAVGLERLALLLSTSSIPPHSPPLVFVAGFGKEGRPTGFKILQDLRKAGISADMDYRALTLKAQLRAADRLSAMVTIILGDDEVSKGIVIMRDMQSKKQKELPIMAASKRLISWIDQHDTRTRIS